MFATLGLLFAAISHTLVSAHFLSVNTTVGTVIGLINGTTPDVVQYLGIPYAEPPVGDLRWTVPTPKTPLTQIDATSLGASCPQYNGAAPNIWDTDAPEFVIYGPTSEDCLTLNVWAPSRQHSLEKLPVIVWLYGGSFITGGAQIKYQDPSQWIQRSQKHIVVGIKYISQMRN
jgi:acetylcholinesterase